MTKSELLKTAKPILFSGEMVRAILEGRKTMTRRVVKPQNIFACEGKYIFDVVDQVLRCTHCGGWVAKFDNRTAFLPPHCPGDILYVRETWQSFFPEEVTPHHQQGARSFSGVPAETAKGHYMYFYYRADGEVPDNPEREKANWLPSIHMPKVAARIFLRVKSVRAERVQDITEEDAIAEGMSKTLVDGVVFISAKGNFHVFWDSLNIKRGYGWDTNPWVWVIEFERVKVDE